MSWNYRVIRTRGETAVATRSGVQNVAWTVYELREVYYDKAGTPNGASERAMPVSAETVLGLHWHLAHMLNALTRPVLEFQGDKLVEVEASTKDKTLLELLQLPAFQEMLLERETPP